jgi:hypothetical protein
MSTFKIGSFNIVPTIGIMVVLCVPRGSCNGGSRLAANTNRAHPSRLGALVVALQADRPAAAVASLLTPCAPRFDAGSRASARRRTASGG